MPSFRAPRGTYDILPEEQPYWVFALHKAAETSARFGYGRIDTPMFEATDLFERGVGDATDIVQKEMYTFEDHGGDSLTLRPEGTANVCRAYVEHGLHNQPQPVRMYYTGAIFRYERPQAGRFRQHTQFGVEAIGDSSPQVDVEVIELGWSFIRSLNITGTQLRINSIGDPECRPAYLDALRDYYRNHIDEVCDDDRQRLERAPLRLLDCKKTRCQAIGNAAPRSTDFLCDACEEHWMSVITLLDGLKDTYPDLEYYADHRLVRGLDYYTRTVFEIEPENAAGQSTLLGGGRYDGLIELIGGQPTSGIGFGSGLDRLVAQVKEQHGYEPPGSGPDVVIVHLGEDAGRRASALAAGLRDDGLTVIVAPAGRSMRAQMRYSNSMNAQYALIIGDREIESGEGSLRPLQGDGEQLGVPLSVEAIADAVRGS
ncbi:MAG: histidine--tRNA ligase [Dehalococcoidia bacterium]|jgi:histidyl-tRNA synthetase|nr:histidine--tRNA ligase [Dehalococcoidia bacterium]